MCICKLLCCIPCIDCISQQNLPNYITEIRIKKRFSKYLQKYLPKMRQTIFIDSELFENGLINSDRISINNIHLVAFRLEQQRENAANSTKTEIISEV